MDNHSITYISYQIKKSLIHGHGLFTTEDLVKGQVIIKLGGIVITRKEVVKGICDPKTTIAISEKEWLGNTFSSIKDPDDYINHCCNPNIGFLDSLTLVAMQDVKRDSELTADYSIWINNAEYLLTDNCLCGSKNCRKRISGNDWLRLDVIVNNYGFFSPFLNKRIKIYLEKIAKSNEKSPRHKK